MIINRETLDTFCASVDQSQTVSLAARKVEFGDTGVRSTWGRYYYSKSHERNVGPAYKPVRQLVWYCSRSPFFR